LIRLGVDLLQGAPTIMTFVDPLGVAPMPSFTNAAALAGIALFDPDGHNPGNLHDQASREMLVSRLAALLRLPVIDVVQDAEDVGPDVLLVPRDTLIGEDMISRTVFTAGNLLGGRVPHRFIATKAITHGLIDRFATCPAGWSIAMAERLGDAALDGYTAFSVTEAIEAGRRLLERGPVRVKDVLAKAGLGQTVVDTPRSLAAAIANQDEAQIAAFGIVLEENLLGVETYSVGTLSVGGLRISYVGDQRETTDHKGREVYGGSRLRCVRGDLDRLTHLGLTTEAVEAVRCAAVFDDAAQRAYPDLVLTRRNYDVLAGKDARGRRRVGVLEQSWRVGGATGAEIAALEAFAASPELTSVETATVEVYGLADVGPDDVVYFRGEDPKVGPMTKYVTRTA
jgi:hypothetical protein